MSYRNNLIATSTSEFKTISQKEFIEKYLYTVCVSAVGCADLQAPANAWLTRAGENVIIRCNDTHETWYFTCQRGHWLGNAGNCSTGLSLCLYLSVPVASLGWVSPGAATEGVTPIFFQKDDNFFCSISLGCQPPSLQGVIPRLFYLSHLGLSTILCKFAYNFFLKVSPPGGCHSGQSAPPLSDATGPCC